MIFLLSPRPLQGISPVFDLMTSTTHKEKAKTEQTPNRLEAPTSTQTTDAQVIMFV